jgi:hypothetical protein
VGLIAVGKSEQHRKATVPVRYSGIFLPEIRCDGNTSRNHLAGVRWGLVASDRHSKCRELPLVKPGVTRPRPEIASLLPILQVV